MGLSWEYEFVTRSESFCDNCIIDHPEDGNDSAICVYQLWNNEACKSQQVTLIQIYAQTLVKDGPQAADARLEALLEDPAYKMPVDYLWTDDGEISRLQAALSRCSQRSNRNRALLKLGVLWLISGTLLRRA
jgi:hypothetical protein